MDSMDLKGIAWVGNIYQKFEAMCLEVEEAMCQETAKYVENQVQTVGAGMKRFCSDVVQDLLPPSSKDLSRVASADLLLNPYLEFGIHKKSISNIKEDAVNVGTCKDKSDSSSDVWEDWAAASFDWEVSDKDDEDPNPTTRKPSNETIVKPLCNKSSAKVVKRSRCISSTDILRAERADTRGSSGSVPQAASSTSGCEPIDCDVSDPDLRENSRHTSPSVIDSNVSANTLCGRSVVDEVVRPHIDSCENSSHTSYSLIGSNVGANTQCCQSADDEVFRPHTDYSPDSGEDTENDANVQFMESVANEFESAFEETCVLVDRNDLPGNHKEERRRSYKKKIQNAFSLKKKPERKHEYTARELPTHDSLDSEWELL